MKRPKRILPLLGAAFLVPAAVFSLQFLPSDMFTATAAAPDFLEGCADVPEAVAMAEELRQRNQRLEAYMVDLDRRKAEITKAEESLRSWLEKVRSANSGSRAKSAGADKARQDDLARMIALYDEMAPKDSAAVLSNLPPDFAAEILMRVDSGTGAKIIAAIDPRQAAELTARMGVIAMRKLN
ncbi:MotE family protein [Paracoccus pacificus]|uniref:MotE family protein n=1 Tax=Paracoccus pacificus TaxID=1463598 RepID=A0ABW4RC94_9RHOB